MNKALDATEDWQFNQKHPRGFGGKFGPKPAQIAAQEAAVPPDTSGDPADSEEVDTGTNEQDAKVAVSAAAAKRLKKSAASLVVVFASRADATKFAIAAEHATESDTPFKVTAAANGKYHVEPEGLTAAAIDSLQEQVHAHRPLSEIELDQAPQADAPEEENVSAEPVAGEGTVTDGAAANSTAVAQGWEETARELLAEAVHSGKVTETTLPDVMRMVRGIQAISDSRENGVLPVMEALHYGTLEGLKNASEADELDAAARARMIMDHIGLEKGLDMPEQLLLLKVKDEKHDSMENDGKALPLGTNERVTDPAGQREKIGEKTARYPRTGHKQARRPKLIVKRAAQVPIR